MFYQLTSHICIVFVARFFFLLYVNSIKKCGRGGGEGYIIVGVGPFHFFNIILNSFQMHLPMTF